MAASMWEALAVLLIAVGLWQGTNQLHQQAWKTQLQSLSQELDQGVVRAKRVVIARQEQGRSAVGTATGKGEAQHSDAPVLSHFFTGYQRRIVCLRHCADLPHAMYAVELRVQVRPEYRARLAGWLRARAWIHQSATEWLSVTPVVNKVVSRRYAPLTQDDSLQHLLRLAS